MSRRRTVRNLPQSNTQSEAPIKKRPLSAAQCEARRRNAQRSTGPTSLEGKQKSRLNAWKHGFRASVALDHASQSQLARRNAQLEADIRPLGGTERLLVREVAWASVRLDRLRDEDETAYEKRRRETLDAFDQSGESAAAALADRLRAEDPAPLRLKGYGPNIPPMPLEPIDRARLVDQLETTCEGCAVLADLWDELTGALTVRAGWSLDHARHMLRLLGHGGPPPEDKDDPSFGHWLDAASLAGRRDERDALASLYKMPMPSAGSARERLLTLAREESARLAERCERMWRERESVARAEALRTAATEVDSAGQLRHRYMASASNQMHRALRLLDRLRNSSRLCLAIDLDETPVATQPPAAIEPPESPAPATQCAPAPNEPKIIQVDANSQDTFNKSQVYPSASCERPAHRVPRVFACGQPFENLRDDQGNAAVLDVSALKPELQSAAS